MPGRRLKRDNGKIPWIEKANEIQNIITVISMIDRVLQIVRHSLCFISAAHHYHETPSEKMNNAL